MSGIFSWFDYRKEEVKLLDEEVGVGFRTPPQKGNWWRWYETHMILFVFLIVVTIVIFVETQIILQIY